MNSYEHTSRDFLPLSVIRSACAGDTDGHQGMFLKFAGQSKFCYKEMELPIE